MNRWWEKRTRLRLMSVPAALLALAVGSAQPATAERTATASLYWSSPIAVDPGAGFYGISCASASLCVAADYAGNIVTSTHPTEAGSWSLAYIEGLELTMVGSSDGGVSCVSTPLCVVTARNEIIASTNPSGGSGAWTITSAAYRPTAISCASSTMCVAVGEQGRVLTATDPTGGSTAWTATQVDGENHIDGVSCSSSTLCVAVDDHGDVLTSTNPTGGASAWAVSHVSSGPLYSVACTASELCFAAGAYRGPSFVSVNPTGGVGSWTLTEGVDGSSGVSCAASTLCVAAGNDTNAGLAESANPVAGTSSWYQGEPGNVGDRAVDGVSCASISLCLAVAEGNVFVAAPAHRLSVTLHGSGSGGVVSTPAPCPFNSCSHPGPRGIEPQPITEIQCSDSSSLMPDDGCAFGFPVGSEVTLAATPAGGSTFAGWSGGCSGDGACTVDMSSDQSLDATFIPASTAIPDSAAARPTVARISSLRESNSVFAVAGSATPLTGHTARHGAHGTVFSFALSQAATVKLAITTASPGRRRAKRCQPERHRLGRKPRCTRTVTIATLTRTAGAGTNSVAFTGRIGHQALRPGHYKALFTATDNAGASAPHTLSFTVVAH